MGGQISELEALELRKVDGHTHMHAHALNLSEAFNTEMGGETMKGTEEGGAQFMHRFQPTRKNTSIHRDA